MGSKSNKGDLFETWFNDKNIQFIGGETAKPTGVVPLRPASVAAGLGIYRKTISLWT